jgi:hypothetical protein
MSTRQFRLVLATVMAALLVAPGGVALAFAPFACADDCRTACADSHIARTCTTTCYTDYPDYRICTTITTCYFDEGTCSTTSHYCY